MRPGRRVVVVGGVLALLLVGVAQAALAQEPAVGVPLDGTLEERVLRNEVGLNLLLVVLGGALVVFMQAGFAMVESGYTRAKNAAQVALQNFTVFGVAMLGYFAVGYGLQFAAVAVPAIGLTEPAGRLWPSVEAGLFGVGGFFLAGATSPGALGFFLFQAAFMDTAATIPTGSMQERWRFGAFVWWGLFCGAVYFPLYGAWVWGGGWLSTLGTNLGLGNGVVDFAGSGVVHGIGGAAALTGAIVLGPRMGKYRRDGTARVIAGHNIPLALLGTFILLFGWFGFNAASTFAATDTRFALVAANTVLAAAAGTVASLVTSYLRLGKPDPGMIANGMLGGLVAVTGPCAFIAPWAAFVIGALAGATVVFVAPILEHRLRIDDPVGAVTVHLVCGLLGLVAVGVFADGTYGGGYNGVEGAVTGVLYGSAGWGQLAAQLVACLVILVYGCGLSYAYFRLQDAVAPIRSRPEDERVGLDVEELGVLGYPDFAIIDDADDQPAGVRGDQTGEWWRP